MIKESYDYYYYYYYTAQPALNFTNTLLQRMAVDEVDGRHSGERGLLRPRVSSRLQCR